MAKFKQQQFKDPAPGVPCLQNQQTKSEKKCSFT